MMTEVHATANAYWIFAKNKGDTYEQKKAILAIFMMAFLIIIGFVSPSIWKSQKGNKNPRQKILNTIIMKIPRQNKQKITNP